MSRVRTVSVFYLRASAFICGQILFLRGPDSLLACPLFAVKSKIEDSKMRSLAWKARNALADALRFLTGRRPDSPDDPYAAVRSPIKRGSPDNSAAVALDEPD